MKQKAFFIVFEGLSFNEKMKIADTSFNDTEKNSAFLNSVQEWLLGYF